MNPWVCPKCGRVWSGMVIECGPCNRKIGGGTLTPPSYPPKMPRRIPAQEPQ